MKAHSSSAFVSGVFFAAMAAAGAADIPARPELGVLDRASVLPLPVLKATERMISEHERLTQERISILTLADGLGREFPGFSQAVFDEWRKAAPRPPNSILIAVDVKDGEIEIRTGLGLDPVLPAAKLSEIRKRFFAPEWAAGKKSRAVVLSFVEVLRSLESPLVTGNEAVDAFDRAGFSGGWTPVEPPPRSGTAWFLAFLGVAIAGFVLARILVGEVHYTATGWFRVPASRNLRRLVPRSGKTPTLVTGGGVSGRY